MYEINIEIPKKRIGVINKIRKVLQSSYETTDTENKYSVEEASCVKGGSMKEIGINFEIKERG